MVFTYAKVRICNPADRKRGRDFRLLVDSGAVYTIVHGDDLKELGIEPEGKRRFRMADGTVIERGFGVAVAEYERGRAGTVVIFGRPMTPRFLASTRWRDSDWSLTRLPRSLDR